MLLKNSFVKKLYKKRCEYILKISSNYITSCSSIKAKTFGSDFDGFVRFDLFKDSIHFYRIQKDFKGEFSQKELNLIVDKMKRDLKFQY